MEGVLFHFQNLNHSHNLKDETGKSIPTIKVLSLSIRYLKGHLLNILRMRGKDVATEDIKWILTVPSFWSDATKQFMRMAAVQVGQALRMLHALPRYNGNSLLKSNLYKVARLFSTRLRLSCQSTHVTS